MGKRKRLAAEKRKEAQKTQYFAKLNNVPTSPRKMRLLADLIRGMEVTKALGVLKYSQKEASNKLEKLLRSAIANWEQKTSQKAEDAQLYVKTVFVDEGRTELDPQYTDAANGNFKLKNESVSKLKTGDPRWYSNQ
jgi:large subunit ribosomal protein L22